MIYLDHAAQYPVLPSVRKRCNELLKQPGNHQATHKAGIQSGEIFRNLRGAIADVFGVPVSRVILTHSGTTANHIGIVAAHHNMPNRNPVYVTPFFSHSSQKMDDGMVLDPKCYSSGYKLKADYLDELLGAGKSVIYGHPLVDPATGQVTHDYTYELKAFLGERCMTVVDFSQAFFKSFNQEIPVPDWDIATVSSHKIGGPVGMGAVIMRDADMEESFVPEYGTMSHVVAGGFLQAILDQSDRSLDLHDKRMKTWAKFRETLIKCELQSGGKMRVLTRADENNNLSTYNVVVAKKDEGAQYNRFLMYLGENDVCCSETTACAKKADPDHLAYYGFDPKGYDFVRLSIGDSTTKKDIDEFCRLTLAY